ncbi:MAG: (deoxy)nucleoside triphosphate pyrophosphohydrolase [Candidatus Saccharicenans sp.]|nr:MAG: hypothetical protein C0168_07930 [Candidatus Aminicenantes bacterium]HEK84990.1 NUDIX domain-containing protein [Candidatus Aminicenantes bacterium]
MIVVAAVIIQEGRVLLAERQSPEGGWEFPGGKKEKVESPQLALKREIREELGLEISIGQRLTSVDFGKNSEKRLIIYSARIESGHLKLSSHRQIKWVKPEEIIDFNLLLPDRIFINKIDLKKIVTDFRPPEEEKLIT